MSSQLTSDQKFAERMNAKDRASQFVTTHANKSSGKWQGQEFTGDAAEMGNRTFADRGDHEKAYNKQFDFG